MQALVLHENPKLYSGSWLWRWCTDEVTLKSEVEEHLEVANHEIYSIIRNCFIYLCFRRRDAKTSMELWACSTVTHGGMIDKFMSKRTLPDMICAHMHGCSCDIILMTAFKRLGANFTSADCFGFSQLVKPRLSWQRWPTASINAWSKQVINCIRNQIVHGASMHTNVHHVEQHWSHQTKLSHCNCYQVFMLICSRSSAPGQIAGLWQPTHGHLSQFQVHQAAVYDISQDWLVAMGIMIIEGNDIQVAHTLQMSF